MGYIEVQTAFDAENAFQDSESCTPRYFTVQEYDEEHKTPPSVFFDRVQISLLRIAVRTLSNTRSNDELALRMINYTLSKTSNPFIVKDKFVLRESLKLIRDREGFENLNKRIS